MFIITLFKQLNTCVFFFVYSNHVLMCNAPVPNLFFEMFALCFFTACSAHCTEVPSFLRSMSILEQTGKRYHQRGKKQTNMKNFIDICLMRNGDETYILSHPTSYNTHIYSHLTHKHTLGIYMCHTGIGPPLQKQFPENLSHSFPL